MNTIKLLKKGIKLNGEYYPCWYNPSKNNLVGCATIYINTYKVLPEWVYDCLYVENNSDIITDYFEKNRIRIPPGSPYFEIVEKLARE